LIKRINLEFSISKTSLSFFINDIFALTEYEKQILSLEFFELDLVFYEEELQED
jgi:hypothetical protein